MADEQGPQIVEWVGEPEPIDDRRLIEAIEEGDGEACERWLDEASTSEAVYAIAGLSDAQRASLMTLVSPESAGELLVALPESQAVETLEELPSDVAAAIIGELASDERADFIKELDTAEAEAILTGLDPEVAEDVRHLAAYEEGTAGALMLTEFLAYPEQANVRDVLGDIQTNAEQYADYNIQYIYVVDDAERLRGVVPLRRILLTRRASTMGDIMIPEPVTVRDTLPIEDLKNAFREYEFIGLPVVDDDGTLLGVVERIDVTRAEVEEADERYRQTQGIVGGEELRSMPLLLRSRRRLAWLSANIVLNIIAASVIAVHQDTLEAVIALAVFLPIISDMSGCSGNQAVAVSMRELTLGVTQPKDFFRVLFKESAVGLINGIALGLLIGAVAYLWKGNIFLGVVVGASLALNTIVAVIIGGLVPLLLKRMKTDPALASGPILTTVTDMCGFFIVLTFASQMLSLLQ